MKVGGSANTGKTKTDIGKIYWDKIQQLMEMDEEMNRINRGNAFGGWEYGIDPKTGKRTQEFVARSPGMQAAQDRMDRRLAGEGFERYERPSQVSAITDALMADKMERMGLLEPGTTDLRQDEYGQRMGAINNQMAQPQAQPQPPSQPQPPPTNRPMPPGQGNRPMPPGVRPGTPPPQTRPGMPPDQNQLLQAYGMRGAR
jgi:hypothetical protein